jgi:hypothetical protein
VSDDKSNALRSAKPEALRTFTLQMLRERVNLTDAQIQEFLERGMTTVPFSTSSLGCHKKSCPTTSAKSRKRHLMSR